MVGLYKVMGVLTARLLGMVKNKKYQTILLYLPRLIYQLYISALESGSFFTTV